MNLTNINFPVIDAENKIIKVEPEDKSYISLFYAVTSKPGTGSTTEIPDELQKAIEDLGDMNAYNPYDFRSSTNLGDKKWRTINGVNVYENKAAVMPYSLLSTNKEGVFHETIYWFCGIPNGKP